MRRRPWGKTATGIRPLRYVVVALSCCLLAAGCSSSGATGGTTKPSLGGTSGPGSSSTSTSTSTSTTTTTLGLPQPSAAKPLKILEIGDSLGEDLGLGLGYTLTGNPLVRVFQDAVGDTGLARPDYYDWPAHLAAELRQDHPQVVMVLVGGNDAQNFLVNGAPVVFGTPQWHRVYSQRVALMMSETIAAGAKMLWVGLPIMQDPSFAAEMKMLNSIYKTQDARHRGAVYFPTWSLFSNAQGQYTAYLTNSSGQTVLARDPDGVHIAPPGGCDIIAIAATKKMEKLWHVHIGV